MQSNSEGRIIRLETLMRSLLAQFRTLTNRADSLDNSVRQSSGMQYNWGGGGGSSAAGFWCVVPSGGPYAGTSMSAPTSFTASTVYTLDGSPTAAATSATVYYHPPVDLESGDTVMLLRNANGSFSVINKVCIPDG